MVRDLEEAIEILCQAAIIYARKLDSRHRKYNQVLQSPTHRYIPTAMKP